jgi:hypothetical protein
MRVMVRRRVVLEHASGEQQVDKRERERERHHTKKEGKKGRT